MVFNFQQVESVFEKPDEKPEEEQSTFASKLFIPFICCSIRTKIMTDYLERGIGKGGEFIWLKLLSKWQQIQKLFP